MSERVHLEIEHKLTLINFISFSHPILSLETAPAHGGLHTTETGNAWDDASERYATGAAHVGGEQKRPGSARLRWTDAVHDVAEQSGPDSHLDGDGDDNDDDG